MAASERVLVLMSPSEMAALKAKARRAGRLSMGEFIRRAVEAYDEETIREAAELRISLDVIASTQAATMQSMDSAEIKLDATVEALRRQPTGA